MNINHLKYFVAVVDHGSISRAAETLNVSQPAVSNSVRLLEHIFGVQLLDRTPRGVIPTPFGKSLHEYASAATGLLQRAAIEIKRIEQGSGGHFNIGVVGSAISTIGPDLVSALMSQDKKFTFSVMAGQSEGLIARLYAGELDFILSGHVAPSSLSDKFVVEKLCSTKTAIFARKGHPLHRQRNISIQDIKKAKWVLPERSLFRQFLERNHFEHQDGFLDVVVTTNANAFIAEIVKSTDLLTSTVPEALHSDVAADTIRPLNFKLGDEVWQVSLIYIKSRHLTQAMQNFIQVARLICKQM